MNRRQTIKTISSLCDNADRGWKILDDVIAAMSFRAFKNGLKSVLERQQ